MDERLSAFEELLRLSAPRVPGETLSPARDVLRRAGERRRMSLAHTVVALAGTTGSGKSSLFNAVCGLDLSVTGVRRPTTSTPVACVWRSQGAGELLDRLGVPERSRFSGHGALDTGRLAPPDGLPGLVLLDLPDLDSADRRQREQMDRMLGLVDAMVWVLDPEKYADASVHERCLRPLVGHAEVMVVVLNQIDRLPQDAVLPCLTDLRRLLDEDGLASGEHGEDGTQVFATSALTGQGVGELRAALGRMVRERRAAERRLRAELDRVARRLRPVYVGGGPVPGLGGGARERFADRLAEAVGARAAGRAAERDWIQGIAAACAPPYGRFLTRSSRGRGTEVGPVPAHRPLVAEAVREVVRVASSGLPEPWATGVRTAGERGGRALAWELDDVGRWTAVSPWPHPLAPDPVPASGAGAEQGAEAAPVGQPTACPRQWWRPVAVVQWLLAGVVLLGLLGLLARAAAVAGIGRVTPGDWTAGTGWRDGGPWWLPGLLLGTGLTLGLLLTWLGRWAAGSVARHCGQEVERRIGEAAEERGHALVIEPIEAELRCYHEVRQRYGAVAAGSGPIWS
ncbi:hypothetical protein AQ490_05895 [Wenjunlia vitaminophila]|uniref:G domain-containing protein n=1 Tax=Wenjunlia vitaminophila TaxID=76728 RepID=A0A0T6LPA5_WENVI|nr:hypothetical protein AQ490_05895 [Wenjunlia vitaminophila]